ncbi:MAG: type II toxin-antitoxin system Phd/YefM family antitoxin [Kiloniellaceae bacterium]
MSEGAIMPTKSITEAREDLAETVNRVAYRGDRVRLTRRGKALAALIPAEDLDLLEALEDRADLEAAREALAESSERIPYAEVRRKLGLE